MNLTNAVLLALIFYAIYKIAKFFWMKWFDGTLICYSVYSAGNSLNPPVPFEFEQNGTLYKVFVTHDEIENTMLGAKLSRSNIYINDKPALMISRMQEMVFVRRSVDADLQHMNPDVFKILKWARMHWHKQFSEEYKRYTEDIKNI